jgi:hypothetical protein
MECPTKNSLILRYLSCQVKKARAETRLRQGDPTARALKALNAARSAMDARRRELLDHCEEHGCSRQSQ